MLYRVAAVYCEIRFFATRFILNLNSQVGTNLSLLRREADQILKSCPWWSRGFQISAHLSERLDDIPAAYAAAKAAQSHKLSSKKTRMEGELVLAKCYLRYGAPQKTIDLLSAHNSILSQRPQLVEELAAAHMAIGNYKAAMECLENLPLDKLSAEARAALTFCKSKNQSP